jgi:tetratricopeptide (TPR) repeat protein
LVVAEKQPVKIAAPHHHYNPDWLSDDAIVGNFVARLDEYTFLRDELAQAKLIGSAQHYLLVGVRGAGKTTLLKRLAVAIRRDADLADHLIALSFPEELYQVKNLSDFWWAACEALADELDRMSKSALADQLHAAIRQAKKDSTNADSHSDTGFKCLLQTCAALKRRPVLLVDNLDMVFQRIDKTGRKLKDAHAPAYWALREALSTTTSPIVIGGSVRLSEPFTDYDKAFYDFFIPKRLGKLSIEEARLVLDRLADAQHVPEVKQRLKERPSRVEALYDLTGGNPRAIGLIFELLRQGPNSRVVEDFERLMDITTPYYKARFEDLAEQAQVVMHGLAVCRPEDGDDLRFGLTAAEIAAHAGLPTGTVSAQLDAQEREGLVEKTAAHGRTQYRIAEQLFRLWLQMRGSRRIRENVMGLSRFLEAMFSFEELHSGVQAQSGAGSLAEARYAFAVAGASSDTHLQRGLAAKGANHVLQHIERGNDNIDEYLSPGDLPADLEAIVHMRRQLQQCDSGLSVSEQDALLGAIRLSLEQKQAAVQALCTAATAPEAAARLRPQLATERQMLLRNGMQNADLELFFRLRAQGYLPLPQLSPDDVETVCALAGDADVLRAMAWRLLGTGGAVRLSDEATASAWLDWGNKFALADATEWANVAGTLRNFKRYAQAKQALEQAFLLGNVARAWHERAALLDVAEDDLQGAEQALRRAIELDSMDAWPHSDLGTLLADKQNCYDEAEQEYRKAIAIDPLDANFHNNLGNFLADKLNCHDEAEREYRKSIELDPLDAWPHNNLGVLLADKLNRYDEAEQEYRKSIELDPLYALPHNNLGNLLADKLKRYAEAEQEYRKATELDPLDALPHYNLGRLLDKVERLMEAGAAYAKGMALDPDPIAFLRKQRAAVQTRLSVADAREALVAGNLTALHDVLSKLLAESADLAFALVSKHFVEDFLTSLLAKSEQAKHVLSVLRSLDYAKHARPLVLAFEAAVEGRSEMLSELEPEVQRAAQRMYERLTGRKAERKPPTKRPAKRRKGSG